MKKILLTIILLLPFFASASPQCISWDRKEFKTGVMKNNHKLVIDDCSCPCNGARLQDNSCMKCGHKKKLSEDHSKSFTKSNQDEYEEYAVDLIATITGTHYN